MGCVGGLRSELLLTLSSDVFVRLCVLVFDINIVVRVSSITPAKNLQCVFKLEMNWLSASVGQIFSRFPLKTHMYVYPQPH